MSVVCFVKFPCGKGLNCPYRTTFLPVNQFFCHFAVPFRAQTAVSHLAQKSTEVYKRAPFGATAGTFAVLYGPGG